MSAPALAAPVFNIQPFCLHDGPGIRTVVFLKGCPLRCLWCANPESHDAGPQLLFYKEKCTGCGACAGACPRGAITPGPRLETDRRRCTGCGACAKVCPAGARELCGRRMTVAEVLEEALGDRLFFEESGGGVTLSGGEPLAHPAFSAALLAGAQAAGVHTAVESCSYAAREAVDLVYAHADLALLDVKHMDSGTHRRLTGVPNEGILENIRHIRRDLGVPTAIRMPVIPGCNDSEENLRATARFAASLGPDTALHLLPCHRLGAGKAERLGLPPAPEYSVPGAGRMEELRALAEACGVPAQVGG